MMEQLHWELLQLQPGTDTQEITLKSSMQRALLLVIDDNEGLIHLLQRHLTDDAYAVMSVPNTEQGLDIIPQLQPDVIILDVMMPGMDGWKLLQRIHTRRENHHPQVVVVVQRAYDGRQACDMMQAAAPDLILLDLVMPVMSGFEVITTMKADARLHDIPIILLTATRYIHSDNEARGDLHIRQDGGLRPTAVFKLLASITPAASPA